MSSSRDVEPRLPTSTPVPATGTAEKKGPCRALSVGRKFASGSVFAARESFGDRAPTRSPSVLLQPAHDVALLETFQTVCAPPRTANVVASSKPATPAESARKRRRVVLCAGAPSALACTRGLTRARSRPSGTASRPTLTSPPARRTGEQQLLHHLHHGSRGSPRTALHLLRLWRPQVSLHGLPCLSSVHSPCVHMPAHLSLPPADPARPHTPAARPRARPPSAHTAVVGGLPLPGSSLIFRALPREHLAAGGAA